MRILHVNKYLYLKGGSEVSILQTGDRLAKRGHEVGYFGADPSPELLASGSEVFAIPGVDYANVTGIGKIRTARDVLWNSAVAEEFEAAVASFQPDVVHLHLYAHQLTSSIVAASHKLGVPTVYTAHDYKLVCPAYVAMVDGHDCFECARRLSSKLLIRRCHQGSAPWSTVVFAEATITRRRNLIPDVVLAPSSFMMRALSDSWVADADIRLVRNPAESTFERWKGGSEFLLYAGRLSREKGVDSLITACAEVGIPLVIAGSGPESARLRALADRLTVAVTFLGHISHEELAKYRRTCVAQVVPSTWPENAPFAALEAAVQGVPLIVSQRGGLPELSEIGARVVSFDELSAPTLRAALGRLENATGDQALLDATLSWESYLVSLEAIYSEVATR